MLGQKNMARQQDAGPGDSRAKGTPPHTLQSKEDVAEDDETPAAECPARGSSRTSPKQPMPLILCTFQREPRGHGRGTQ